MNIYDRIINILLEARIEDYLERLDEVGPVKARNKAISRRELRSGFHQAMSDFSEPSVVARALRKAGEARRAGDKAEARRQVGRSKKLDKPQLP